MVKRLLAGSLLLVTAMTTSANAQPYYNPDILALLEQHGCTGCHGGSGGLTVTPYNSVLTTGSHAPVVVPFDSNSVIVKKLKGTAGFGAQMPRGGTPLSPTEIQVFVQWIMGGALESAPASAADETVTPVTLRLAQNYPNPFNPSTKISFQVPEASDVQLTVYDHLGREVASLVQGRMEAGNHEVTFDATRGSRLAGNARALASGVYLYRLQVRPLDFPLLDSASGRDSESGTAHGRDSKSGAGSFVESKKMILVK